MSIMNSKQVFKILQINLNHCWAAQQLLAQTVVECSMDIVLLNDYYRQCDDDQQWSASVDGKCAVYISTRSTIEIAEKGNRVGFA